MLYYRKAAQYIVCLGKIRAIFGILSISGVRVSMEVKTNVIKRNGEEVGFNLDKIINAIWAANREVDKLHQMNEIGRAHV